MVRDDQARSMLGPRQEKWFYSSLSESKDRGAAWRIIGNQLIFSQVLQNDMGKLSTDTVSVSCTLVINAYPGEEGEKN